MKQILILMVVSLCSFTIAQVGINTNTPKAQLDVNGDVTVRGKIYAGGTETVAGNPGVPGQVLVSSGPGQPPRWMTLNIPDDQGKFYLIYNDTFDDQVGVTFTSSETTGNYMYTKGTLYSSLSGWKKIPGLSQTFEVYSTENKTYFTFEAVAQINTTGSGNKLDAVEFACGIFLDGKLEGVRVNTVEQTGDSYASFRTLTMLHVSENISKGIHNIDIACTRRANYSTSVSLGIGRSVNSENLNNFMAQSSLKIEVFEIPDQYIDIEE